MSDPKITIGAESRGFNQADRKLDSMANKFRRVEKGAGASNKSTGLLNSNLVKMGAVATAGAAAVGAVAMKLHEMAKSGNDAIRVARKFTGDLKALRKASGEAIDDTTLQRWSNMSKEIKLTQQELNNILKFATQKFDQGFGDSIEGNVEAILGGQTRKLIELGVVIDDTSEKFKGLSSTQKKVQIAREVSTRGANINAEALKTETLAIERQEAALGNMISEIEVFVAELMNQSGILEELSGVFEAVTGFVQDHKRELVALWETAKSVTEFAMAPLIDAFSMMGDVIGLVFDALGPVLDALGWLEAKAGEVWGALKDLAGMIGWDVADQSVRGALAKKHKELERGKALWEGYEKAMAANKQIMADIRFELETMKGIAETRVASTKGTMASSLDPENLKKAREEREKLRKQAKKAAEAEAEAQRKAEAAARRRAEAERMAAEALERQLTALIGIANAQPPPPALLRGAAAGATGRGSFGQAAGLASGVAGTSLADTALGTSQRMGQARRGAGLFAMAGGGGAAVGAGQASPARQTAELNEEFAKGTSEALRFASAIGELGGAFGGFFEVIGSNSDRLQEALVAMQEGSGDTLGAMKTLASTGLSAAGAFTAGFIKNQQAQAAVRAAFEAAAALAAYPDPVGMATHGAAAVKFAAVAAGAFKSGGSGAGTGGVSGASAGAAQSGSSFNATTPDRRSPFAGLDSMGAPVEYHMHFPSMDPQAGYRYATKALNDGNKRLTGHRIDPDVIGKRRRSMGFA